MSERDPEVERIVDAVHKDWCPGACDNPNLPLPNCEFRDDVRAAVEAGRELGARDVIAIARSMNLSFKSPAYNVALDDLITSAKAYLARGCQPERSELMKTDAGGGGET